MRSVRASLVLPLALAWSLAAGCGAARFSVVRPASTPPVSIALVRLSWSNVYLLRAPDGAVLVDTGSPGDWDALVAALAVEQLAPRDLRLVVLTHGHGDHAGLAARLQGEGVPIALGAGDVAMAAAGHGDPLRATSPLGDLLRPLVEFPYDAFTPDVVVEGVLALDDYGLPGVRARAMPGHTPGSLVVEVGRRDVIVGDQILGGLGVELGGGNAGEAFYQADLLANHCNVLALVQRGVVTFHPGHGGPIDRTSVIGWQADWASDVPRCRARRAARAAR